MIKARLDHQDKSGKSIALFGITGENMARMLDGDPIMVDLADIGLPSQRIIIMAGHTEEAILEKLAEEFKHGT